MNDVEQQVLAAFYELRDALKEYDGTESARKKAAERVESAEAHFRFLVRGGQFTTGAKP